VVEIIGVDVLVAAKLAPIELLVFYIFAHLLFRILEVFTRWVLLHADDLYNDSQATRLIVDFAKYTLTPDHAQRFSSTILTRMHNTKPTNVPYFDKSQQHSYLNILNAG
jgi:hypothetical protein